MTANNETWKAALLANGHEPVLNPDGSISMNEAGSGLYEGPGCGKCNQAWPSRLCGPESVSPCEMERIMLQEDAGTIIGCSMNWRDLMVVDHKITGEIGVARQLVADGVLALAETYADKDGGQMGSGSLLRTLAEAIHDGSLAEWVDERNAAQSGESK